MTSLAWNKNLQAPIYRAMTVTGTMAQLRESSWYWKVRGMGGAWEVGLASLMLHLGHTW